MLGRRAVPPSWLSLAIGFAVLLVYAYPGYMSSDSAIQLTEARTHVHSDIHPAAMAALWRVVEFVVTGPVGMLVLQGSVFLIGTYWILRRHLADRSAAIAASAILMFPPVLAIMAVVWKDCQMAGFLVLGIALVGDPRASRRWLGVVAIAFAIAVRHNAPAAALPIFVFAYAAPTGRRRWKHLTVGLALWLAATGAAMATNRALTDVQEYPWYYSIGPADIVGVLHYSRAYDDAELLEILDGTPLVARKDIFKQARRIYNPTLWWWTVNGDDRIFDWPTTEAQRAAMVRAWTKLVSDNPAAYLEHRLRMFRVLLGLPDRFGNALVSGPVWRVHMDQAQVRDPGPSSLLQKAIGRALEWFAAHTPIYRPYIYFVLALVFLPLARRHRDALGLLSSGIVYQLTFLPLSPSSEFRYTHWMITSVVISTVILVKRRMAVTASSAPGESRPDTTAEAIDELACSPAVVGDRNVVGPDLRDADCPT